MGNDCWEESEQRFVTSNTNLYILTSIHHNYFDTYRIVKSYREYTMDTKKMAKVFKALSNPNRLELYMQIVEKQENCYETNCECLIHDIAKSLNIGAPTISHHLKELSNAELIFTERKGKYVVARVNEEMVDEVNKLLKLHHGEK